MNHFYLHLIKKRINSKPVYELKIRKSEKISYKVVLTWKISQSQKRLIKKTPFFSMFDVYQRALNVHKIISYVRHMLKSNITKCDTLQLIYDGDINKIKKLVKKRRLIISDSLIRIAIHYNQLDIVKFFIKNSQSLQFDPMLYSIKYGDLEMVKFFNINHCFIDIYIKEATKYGHEHIREYFVNLQLKKQ